MLSQNLHAYIVPTSDAHQSEYVADYAQRRRALSGFTGSAGTALVTQSHALLWTDGRYFLQATTQLDASLGWALMKDRLPTTPSVEAWLLAHAHATAPATPFHVGIDATLFSEAQVADMLRLWAGSNVALRVVRDNLVDAVWPDRPAVPVTPLRPLPLRYAGVGAGDKLRDLRLALRERAHGDAVALSALDEIAWLFNVRGGDVEFNPVVIAYAIVTADAATLYMHARAPDAALDEHLRAAGVQTAPYDRFAADVAALVAARRRVWLDPATSSHATCALVPRDLLVSLPSPIPLAKALKNAAELSGARACHVRDASAVVKFLAWLERQAAADALPTEIGASDWLAAARAQLADFVSLSFDTISGAGPHGAIIHYKASAATDRRIGREMYLVDSGGQYVDGTTDITRTLHFGVPSEHERRCYTRVLQGHIDLGLAVFPAGTSGGVLDVLARAPLYRDGLDYAHGTGHGVGAFLNVHEGPHGISFREGSRKQALLPGMLVTDEPGYYEDGAFGIRIENVLEVVPARTLHNFAGTGFYTFRHLTLVPYERRLINVDMLTAEQRDFVNRYHAECRAAVAPLLQQQNEQDALLWLERHTAPL
jgi:Xaa-Pro aminopeptidase